MKAKGPKVWRDADHRYWLERKDGKPYQAVSVTRSILAAGMVDETYFTDLARQRGRIAHYFAELVLIGRLREAIPREMAGYMVALRKFLDRYAPTVINAETIMIDPNFMFGGTEDAELQLLGAITDLEVKTSQPTMWHGMQLGAYSYLRARHKWVDRQRMGLYLKPTGGFRLYEYDSLKDCDNFFRCLELMKLRIEHGTYDQPYGSRNARIGSASTPSGVRWTGVDDGDTPEGGSLDTHDF